MTNSTSTSAYRKFQVVVTKYGTHEIVFNDTISACSLDGAVNLARKQLYYKGLRRITIVVVDTCQNLAWSFDDELDH